MKQQDFENKHQATWARLETMVEPKGLRTFSKKEASQFPSLYRLVCSHLAIAKERQYSPQLIQQLNKTVMAAHHLLYEDKNSFNLFRIAGILYSFPRALRAQSKFVWASTLLFLVPLIGMTLICYFNDHMIHSLMSPEQVREMESMYDPEQRKLGRVRESDSDLYMFGYYIWNNIGIAFRAFAMGLLFGLGTIYVLIFNGLSIGAVMGHLTQLGFTSTFYPFVIGHGAFELTAIVFSGAAGLMLGFALVSPGNLTRIDALKKAANEAIKIMYGAGIMLLIAAFIEAYWSSSSTLPIWVKLAVGSVLWILVIAYCVLAGRTKS